MKRVVFCITQHILIMTTVLMIAEKPSLAQSLANILSNGKYKTRKGINNACSVHEFRSTFRNNSANVRFSSVCGHVMSTNFTGKYNNWDRVEPRELFDAPIIKEEANPKLQMIKFLQKEARGCEYLVLWLDCDKEGENICFEVINAVSQVMRISFSHPQTVFRSKFSAITDKDIKNAMNNLVLPNELESLSVDARQELDLRIGCAFTRFQTRFFHGKYGDLDSSLISFGPCQTPTLAFCVDRHDKIQSFKPEPYWVLNVSVRLANNESSIPITLDWDRGREFNHNAAKAYLNLVNSQKRAKVVSISKKEKTKARQSALNTVELLKIASSGLGIGPHTAMQIAEKLYTQGFISYPRTETTTYGKNFDLIETLKIQTVNSEWGNGVKDLLRDGITKPRGGHDAGDHPPITPMKNANPNDFSDKDMWRIYDYITRHFIASLCADMKYEVTTVSFSIGSETFSKVFNSVIDPGFTKFMPWQALPSEQKLSSDIKVGAEYLITDTKLVERMTTAPDYLTESELISLMEKHGIGTDASIPTHINNICLRNYVKVTTGRRLVPTLLGIVLVHGYQKINNELVLPTSRAAIEQQLNQIALGTANFDSTLNKNIKEFLEKFDFFVNNIQLMDELFEVSFSSLAESGKPISRCGKCRRYMKLIVAKPQRIYCGTCNETFQVPQSGNIKTFKEERCPIDDYELLYYYRTGAEKSFVFCPNCFNNPPFENMTKHSGCNQCVHQTCKYSMIANSLTHCYKCKFDGLLVLDSGSGPPVWKICCNKCNFSITGFRDANKVAIENQFCEKCNKSIVSVEYKSEKSKLSDGSTLFNGCIWCSGEFSSLVRAMEKLKLTNEPTNVNRNYSSHGPSRGGGRGRGRGRGGRGRRRGMSSNSEEYSHSAPKSTMQLSDYF